MSGLDDMYREVVLEHHREPHGRAPLNRVDAEASGVNPSCGDEVSIRLQIDAGRIVGVNVDGRGCAISTASGSMLSDLIEGLGVSRARELAAACKSFLRGDDKEVTDAELGDLEALAGVRRFPLRIRCALLPWTALEQALAEWAGRTGATQVSTEEEVIHGPS